MPSTTLERKLSLPTDSEARAIAAIGRVLGGPGAVADFEARNPEDFSHMCDVAAIMGTVLCEAGASEPTTSLGEDMGAAHDWGKDGLRTNNTGVWTPDHIIRFRREHTQAGASKVREAWNRFDDPFALFLATLRHHSGLPPEYHKLEPSWAHRYGLLHLLIAADRWSAFTRQYAQETGACLTLEEGMDAWVLNGRPDTIPAVAVVGGLEIHIPSMLLPLMETIEYSL